MTNLPAYPMGSLRPPAETKTKRNPREAGLSETEGKVEKFA